MATWNQGFFNKDSKEAINYAGNFQKMAQGFQSNLNWDYMNPTSGKLGKHEMKYNRNLLNPNNFAQYWQTGKHKGYEIYNQIDLDGDTFEDMIAVNPKDGNRVMGFNEKYITDDGKGETPYRREYYKLTPKQREQESYMEFLDNQNTIEGWRDIKKLKTNRSTAVWQIIKAHLNDQFNQLNATEKERENICKRLVKMIQTTFFDCAEVVKQGEEIVGYKMKSDGVPSYQMKVITESPEFKKILSAKVTASTIGSYIPQNAKNTIATGMLQLVRGYGNSIERIFIGWLAEHHNNDRLSVANALNLYKSIIIKQAANKLYKEKGLTAAEAANNEALFNEYKQALLQKQQELANKYATQTYTLNA